MEGDKDIDQNDDTTKGNPPTPSTKQTPKSMPEPPDFMSALRDMEERLTNNMQAMLKPLQSSINTLLGSQQEWESHKQKVNELEKDKKRLNQRISEAEKKNENLETRLKKLEDKLMECNIIVHGIKESAWELDSTQKELVIQTLADTIQGPDDKKLEIAR